MSLGPTQRLLWLVLGAAILGTVAGPLPELMPVWVLGLFAVALAALGDLAACLSGARPPEVSLPPVTRFRRGRPGAIRVTFSNPRALAWRMRFALGLPPAFVSRDEEMRVNLPAGSSRASIDWPCTPGRRGRFRSALACVQTDSRFGLWHMRTRVDVPCELRVYPNLFLAAGRLAALTLARGENGIRVRRTVGRGREFEKLRDYLPGDSFDEIHWKATAKRNRPITKVFQIERTQEIYVIVDSSRLSGRLTFDDGVARTALEGYLTAALVLMVAAERQGDRFGLAAYDDRVRVFLRAGHSGAHYAACREAVLTLEPSEHTPDMAEIVRHLCTHLRRRALLFFLTDLSDPVLAEDFVRNARVLSRQHLVFVSQMRAPEVAPLFEGEEVASDGEVYKRLAGHLRWSELRGLAQRLRPAGVTASLLDQDTMAAELVSQYLQVKQRQAL
jgi:uncharacterized protein (DUF58 family)